MALNIKNKQVEKLVEDVISITGENKTEAILNALRERKMRLGFRVTPQGLRNRKMSFLTNELWPVIPPEEMGREMTSDEHDAILGFGEDGV